MCVIYLPQASVCLSLHNISIHIMYIFSICVYAKREGPWFFFFCPKIILSSRTFAPLTLVVPFSCWLSSRVKISWGLLLFDAHSRGLGENFFYFFLEQICLKYCVIHIQTLPLHNVLKSEKVALQRMKSTFFKSSF